MLEDALPDEYRSALEQQNFVIWEHTFQETVDTLVTCEDKIRRDYQTNRDVRRLLDANNMKPTTAGKAGGGSNKSGGGNGDNNGKRNEDEKRKRNSGNDSTSRKKKPKE